MVLLCMESFVCSSSSMIGRCCLQVSDQCVKLVKAGWFDVQKEPSGVSTLTNPKVRSLGTDACPQPFFTAGNHEIGRIVTVSRKHQ